jgi:predicted XRE-type DNA-binding protein
MIAIRQTIEEWDLTPAATAKRLGITVMRLKELVQGNINAFSLDELMKLASTAGLAVTLEVVVSPVA